MDGGSVPDAFWWRSSKGEPKM